MVFVCLFVYLFACLSTLLFYYVTQCTGLICVCVCVCGGGGGMVGFRVRWRVWNRVGVKTNMGCREVMIFKMGKGLFHIVFGIFFSWR